MIHKQKDIMWYIKSVLEAIMIFVFIVCLIGFVATLIIMVVGIPMVWGKPISYHPFPWFNQLAGWSICIGLINLVVMISYERYWRRDYRDEEDSD